MQDQDSNFIQESIKDRDNGGNKTVNYFFNGSVYEKNENSNIQKGTINSNLNLLSIKS